MQQRKCPNCEANIYSADHRNAWECPTCGETIPIPPEVGEGRNINAQENPRIKSRSND